MALFGNPAAKKAAHKQNEIMFNQLALAANLWNKGTAAENTPVSQIDKFNFEICELIKDLNETYQVLVRKKTAA